MIFPIRAVATALTLSFMPALASAQGITHPIAPGAVSPGVSIGGSPGIGSGVSLPREDRAPHDLANRFQYDPEDRDYDLAGAHVPTPWGAVCPAEELAWLLGEPTAAATVLRDALIQSGVPAHNVRIMPETHPTNWSFSDARLTINHHMTDDSIVAVRCY